MIKALAAGLEQMGLAVIQADQQRLIDYIELLDKWNSAYNLSAVRNIEDMVSRHLLDSLSLMPLLMDQPVPVKTLLDVGTGPGLPGIPLAIVFPDRKFLLADSNGKKTRFLFQAKLALGLDNISIIDERIESYQNREQIDIVLSRAFSSLPDLVNKTAHLCSAADRYPGTTLLAMKGVYPDKEIAALPPGWKIGRTVKVEIPGSDAQRHIIELVQTAQGEKDD